jgi:hypothetical protein
MTRHAQIFQADRILNLVNVTIHISTDGGVAYGRGSFGVVFCIQDLIIANNRSRLPDIYNEMHSYRCEGFGIMCGLVLYLAIYRYCLQHHQVSISTTIILQSDRKLMLEKIEKQWYKNLTQKMHNDTDMDVISAIIDTLKSLHHHGVKVSFKFVKGHQDRLTNNLSTEASMNVEADRLATEALALRTLPNDIQLPTDHATITLHGKKITSHRTKTLRQAYQSIQLRQYLKDSNNWSEAQLDNLWWKASAKLMYAITPEKRTIIQKFIHNQLPCNQRNNVMFEYNPPYCTLCDKVTEEQSHVLCCPKCPARADIRTKFKNDFLWLLVDTNTHSTTIRALTFTINAWLYMAPLPLLRDLAPEASTTLQEALEFQRQIGWEQFSQRQVPHSVGAKCIITHRLKSLLLTRWTRKHGAARSYLCSGSLC